MIRLPHCPQFRPPILGLPVLGTLDFRHCGADHLGNSSSNELFVGGSGADIFAAGVGKDSVADFSHAQGDRSILANSRDFRALRQSCPTLYRTERIPSSNLGGGNSLASDGYRA